MARTATKAKPKAAAAQTVYQTFTTVLDMEPKKNEEAKDFYQRVARAGNRLDEEAYDALPADAREWLDEAVLAIKNENPLPTMHGNPFGKDEDEDEGDDTENGDDADEGDDEDTGDDDEGDDADDETGEGDDADDEDDEDEDEEPPAKPAASARGKGKEAEKPKAAAKTAAKPKAAPAPSKATAAKAGSKPAAKGKDAPAPAKAAAKPAAKSGKANGAVTKPAPKKRETSDTGVLYRLMEAALDDPKASATDILKATEKAYPHLKPISPANAIGIKQQFRRLGGFFQKKGLFKKPLFEDISVG